ncbi:MAG: helix-turn-helix transcriptional regulator [Actinomycetota bacterium]
MIGANTAVVGRDEELAALKRAVDGSGGMVLLSGEGGIGKSRLAQEAAVMAAERGRFVVWARPEQIATPGPFALILDLVENIGAQSSLAEKDAEAIASKLTDPSEGADAHAPRRIAAQLRGLLAQAGTRPVAIFEDLHAADEASHAVIVHLARSAADDDRLIVGTYRSDEVAVVDELGRFINVVSSEKLATTLALDPLDRTSAIALATSRLTESGAGQAQWIAAQSEGIPFFIEELVAAFAQTGSMSGVPAVIARAALTRRQQLGEVAKHVLAAAAIESGPIDVEVLAVACDLDPGTVSRALADAARAGIIEDRDERLSFRHALVREAIVADLVSVEAQDLRRRIASAIEQVHKEALPNYSRVLAQQWYEGRDRARAFSYALQAGERALALGATSEARSAYELALACTDAPSGEALMGLAEAEVRDGRIVEASELFHRAAGAFESASRSIETVRAKARRAWALAANYELDSAAEELDGALELLRNNGEEDEPLFARVLSQRGRLLQSKGDIPMLRKAVEIAERSGADSIRADALDGLAMYAHALGDPEGPELAEQACAAALISGAPESIGRTHNNAAIILESFGRPVDSLVKIEIGREHLAGHFGRLGLAFLDDTEASIQFLMGQPDRVLRLLARHDVDSSVVMSSSLTLLAWGSLHAGDVARAAMAVQRARQMPGMGIPAPVPGVASAEGLIALVLTNLESASAEKDMLATSARALLAVNWKPEVLDELRATTIAGRAFVVAGLFDEARDVIARMENLLSSYRSWYFRACVHELAASMETDPSARASSLREAVESFARYPNAVDRARCMRLLAAGLADRDEAIALLRDAMSIAAECGSSLESTRSEAALRALGVRTRAGRPRKQVDSGALSRREEEIAILVGSGATNGDIAARLFLSERTVQDHISHALRKLGFAGRASLAAWAAKNGLV